ncbi:MAG: AEC family transporter [Tractidigestivibacter sp.]|uniref:AEC family transporter n=1 Tax=Tractidigestivibacter sp. TaxID=2847320 RepID=UPI003D8FCF14
MDDLIFSLNATLPIFLTMLVGTFLRKVGVMDEKFTDYLNSFVFKVALPVLLFQDLATQDFASAWDGRYVLFCLVATALSILLIVCVSHFVIHDTPRRGEFIQVSYRSSAAILGIAFIQNIYGTATTGMAPLMILGSVPLYNLVAVLDLTLTAPSTGEKKPTVGQLLRKAGVGIIKNPIIIGILVGLAWSLLRLPMPEILSSTVHNVAVLATPLGLMALGASFSLERSKEEVPAALVASFIKLVALVAIFMPLAIQMGFRDQQLVALLVMLGSASTVSCYIMAKNMGHEGTLTSTTVMMTTFGCAFTLTAWLWLLKSLSLIA